MMRYRNLLGTRPSTVMRRSAAILSATAVAATTALAVSNPAGAVITRGGGANADGTPGFVRDRQGIAVQLCTDAVLCEPAAAPDIGSYFSAEASLGPMRAVWGIEAAFLEDAAGNPTNRAAVSNMALFRAEGLRANRRYTIKGPWGTHRCFTDERGRLDNKNCLFERGGESGGPLAGGPIKTLLRAKVRPAGGFLGGDVARRVTGSPTGFNKVTLDGPGAHFRTSLFTIGGQLVDDTAMGMVAKSRIKMGNKRNVAPVTRHVTYRSVGTAPARVRVSKVGPDPVAFKLDNGCARVALNPGRRCTIDITYRPRAQNSKARLVLDDNGVAAPRRVRLLGITGR
jgi:hypothetical protein